MKKISTILLTLVLSISMLVPSFSALPAYADDGMPAAQSVQADQTDVAAGDVIEANDGAAVGDPADPADPSAEDPANHADDADPADPVAEDPANPADPVGENPADPAAEDTEDPANPEDPVEFGSYDKLSMVALDDAKKIVLPEAVQDKIKVTHTQYGNGLLFTGTVADLNSSYITLDTELDFDSGSVGRLTLDGLKDKDRGMTVEVEIYLDDCKSPCGTIALKKQMGKKEWSNDGEQTFTLGENGISGRHKVALLLKITGKKDTAKTSVMLRSLQFCKTTIPVMYFNIDESEGTIEAMNNSEDHSVECYGTVDLIVPDEFRNDNTFKDEYKSQDSLYGENALELEYIRGRGNSTWGDDKKPYKVKFDKSQNLFGFGKNKHWILLANRYDNSLIRNRMTYWLGQQLGMEYTPQCVPVEVVMNGEFYGSYLLCEQIRVGKGRVEIDDLDDLDDDPALADDVIKSGGYLLSMDYDEDPDRSFNTEQNMTLFIESPDDNVKYFSDYIKAYTQKVENAIFGEGFKDAEGHPYTDYLDLDSAVDYWWIQEFSENGDAYGSGSTYLYKKRDSETDPGKLYWGPLWDFDYVAWGDLDYDSEPQETFEYTGTVWFNRMKNDPEFTNRLIERWNEPGGIKEKMQEITKEGGRLDMYLKQMETSYIYDHDKWGAFESNLTEYKGEIEQLRKWIEMRTEFVDREVEQLRVADHTVKFVIDGKVVKETVVHGFLTESDFPEVPKKEGYVAGDWVDDEDTIFMPGDKVTKDMTLTVSYIEKSKVVEAKDIFFKAYEVYEVIGGGSYYDYEYNYNNEDTETLSWFFMDYKVMPEDAWDTELTWTSSDENIASCMSEYDSIAIKDYGDVTITATLKNGVSRSFLLHVIKSDGEIEDYEGMQLDRTKMTLKVGQYDQILATPVNPKAYVADYLWLSSNEKVATVDDLGVVQAVKPGTAEIMMIDMETREIHKCKVTVKSKTNLGKVVKRNGSTYKITSDKKGARTCMLIKAKNAQKVVVPAYIKYDGKKYNVNKIKARAFAKSKATRVVLKTKKLTKARVKGSMSGSKVKKIYVRVGKTKANKTYIKKYRKIFTKKNAGKAVIVSGS
ncbi:MAG: CotH kinase family protein [Mogibacterium sp.]|nr:CotH kinase family protein [Mogibacterium sp.]